MSWLTDTQSTIESTGVPTGPALGQLNTAPEGFTELGTIRDQGLFGQVFQDASGKYFINKGGQAGGALSPLDYTAEQLQTSLQGFQGAAQQNMAADSSGINGLMQKYGPEAILAAFGMPALMSAGGPLAGLFGGGGAPAAGGGDFFSGMSPEATLASQGVSGGGTVPGIAGEGDFFSGMSPQQALASQGFDQPLVSAPEGAAITPGSSGSAPVQESSFNANGPLTATHPGTGLQGLFGGGIVGSPTSTLQLLQQLSGLGGMGGAGSMPWGSVGNLASMGTGIYGLYQSEQLKKLAQQLGQSADTWGSSGGRSLASQQLMQLMQNPSGVTKLPGYQAGLDAVQRSMAAQGYQGSGNMMASLQQYGGQFYNNAISQLSGLAGTGFNPASGAALQLQGAGSGNNLALNSLGLLSKAAFLAG